MTQFSSDLYVLHRISLFTVIFQCSQHTVLCSNNFPNFYERQLYQQVLLRARISYDYSVCPLAWGVTTLWI